jgi:hypothetical protein
MDITAADAAGGDSNQNVPPPRFWRFKIGEFEMTVLR